ncbi:MAG: hypothetical protein HYX90_03530, partial [Chloroflexi bacterium]|nr:hypothetical protein [Chloroflexota bacterium]
LRHLPNVVMYATTNFDGAMDYALISRSDMVVRFNLPDSAQRRAILRPRLQRLKKETALQQMVDATEGWSGRDLVRINLLAFLESDVASPEELTEEDYLKAVRNGKSTTDRKEEMWSGLSSVSQEASTPRRSKWPWPKR